MILRRLADAIRQQNWFTVVLEIMIVVIGIFIGLQVDDWNEARKDRVLEQRYLERIRADIEKDITLFEFSRERAAERIAQIRFLEAMTRDPDAAAAEPARTIITLEKASWESYIRVEPRTFEEMRGAGLSTLIRDPGLRDAIAEYYREIARWERIVDREASDEQFSFAAAGLLSGEQLAAIENHEDTGDPLPGADAATARALAAALADTPEATRWLPQMQHYHILVGKVVTRHLDAAKALTAEIDAALEGDVP